MGKGAAVLVAGSLLACAAAPALAASPTPPLAGGRPPSAAAGAAPVVTDRESVQVATSATGAVDRAGTWVFDQLQVAGDGSYRISDPNQTRGLRNLDGFAAPAVRGRDVVWSVDVHGRTERRTVARFPGALPVTVAVSYTLDGRPVRPRDVLGRSGLLSVSYTVRNVSARPTAVRFGDGHGHLVARTVPVVTPFVGQLQTTLPGSWTGLRAPRADVAGDGRGGNLLNWTMVLFAPIGEPVQRFGYTVRIDHPSELPGATVQLLVVSPQRHPELKFGQDGFASGAATGAQLVSGAAQLDSGVLRLASGAGQLLAGIVALDNGSRQLSAGVGGQAAPGAQALYTGLTQVSAGLGQLADPGSGLPSAAPGIIRLQAGVDQIVAGLGDPARPGTLLWGLHQIALGVGSATTPGTLLWGLHQELSGVGSATAPGTLLWGLNKFVDKSSSTSLYAALDGLEQLRCALVGQPAGHCEPPVVSDLAAGTVSTAGALDGELTRISGLVGQLCPHGGGPAACAQLRAQLAAAETSVVQIEGNDATIGALLDYGGNGLPSVAQALNLLIDGIGGASPTSAINGVNQLIAGAEKLSAGDTQLLAGADRLAAGDAQLVAGAQRIRAGLGSPATSGTVEWGLAQLAAGVARAVSGVDQLYTGVAGTAVPGAARLAAGLRQAASGSDRVTGGLDQARAGAPQLVAGLRTAHTKGTSVLVAKGTQTAESFGEQYAVMLALDRRGAGGGMPYGAPKGAVGTAAYVFDIAATTTDSRSDAVRLVVAVVLAGVAVLGVAAMGRRRHAG